MLTSRFAQAAQSFSPLRCGCYAARSGQCHFFLWLNPIFSSVQHGIIAVNGKKRQDQTAHPVRLYGLLLFCAALFCSCSGNRAVSEGVSVPEDAEATSKILFLHIWILRDSTTGDDRALLQEMMLVDGHVKERGGHSQDGELLLCSFLDAGYQVLEQQTVGNPLRRRYEAAEEDGTFRSEEVQLDRGQLVLRTQWDDRMRFLRVETLPDSGQKSEVAMITLETSEH